VHGCLGMGIAVVDLSHGGTVAYDRKRSKILVKISESWWAHILRTTPGTPLGPAAFLVLTDLNSRLT